MKLQVAQWGYSFGVRLPRSLVDELGIAPGSELDASLRGDVLRVRPIPPVTRFKLDDLMDPLDIESIPAFEHWPPFGNEIIDDDDSR